LLDNFMYGPDSILDLIAHEALRVCEHDVRALSRNDLTPYDAVFHLAALSGYPACDANQKAAWSINADATRDLCAQLSPSQLLFYASTTSLYGQATDGVSDEDSPVNPISVYGQTKGLAERTCLTRENTVSLRFATIFGVGNRMRSDLLPNDFCYRVATERCLVLFDPRARRTFLHISDAVAGYLLALDGMTDPDRAHLFKGQIFNVGDATLNLSKLEIADEIARHAPFELILSDLADPDPRSFEISFEKFQKLGFSAKKTLEEGVRELLKLYGFYRVHRHFNTI